MNPRWFSLWAVAISLWLIACGGTIFFEQPYHGTQEQKIRARLDRALLELWETSVLWGGLEWGEYHVGGALLQVLEHEPDSSLSINYLSSGLQTEVRDVFITWRVLQADYRLEVLARRPEGIRILEASGRGKSTVNSLQAAQVAIEEAVLDLARQLAALR
ncbi:MAG: hypothetical protein HY694_06425 [Deltaproteobacteria bacterium]|nr:hypothetical protein [Deltaproteobacteria bacterium]